MSNQSAAIVKVAVSKLEIDPMNVRKSVDEQAVADLAESIAANGVLQNIVVRAAPKSGHYYVVIGGRRFRAVNKLIEQKRLPKNFQFDCRIADDDEVKAVEISLAENVMREKMHPLDEFKAYSDLAEKGLPIAEIAARFGATEVIVHRRLKLAKVHPALHDAYRLNKFTLEILSAFAITDDQEAQMRVWESFPSWNLDAYAIKRALSGDSIPFSDKRLVFVGLENYVREGGHVNRDLFDTQDSGFATDPELVEKLFAERLEREAEKVKAEGWAWVDVIEDYSVPSYREYDRHYPRDVTLTEEEQAEVDTLSELANGLSEMIETGDADEDAEAKLAEANAKLAELDRQEYSPEIIPFSGAFVTVTHHGALRVERGFQKKDETQDGPVSDKEQASTEDKSLKLSAAFVEDLTAQKTAALRHELSNNHDTALAAVVHAMLLPILYNGSSYLSCLEISISQCMLSSSMKQPEHSKPLTLHTEQRQSIKDRAPANPQELWDWCLELKRSELLELLAFAASTTVNAVEGKTTYRSATHIAHSNQLAAALGTDMRDYFEPTVDQCFSHMNRATIDATVAEVKGQELANGVGAMKKSDAAAYAAKVLKGTGWLPAPLILGERLSLIEDVNNVDTEEADDVASGQVIQFPEAAA